MDVKVLDNIQNESNEFIKEKEYWLDKLSGEILKSYFPYDYNREKLDKKDKAIESFEFPEDIYLKLLKLCNGSDYKLHMILMTGITILLDKYTGNKDIIIGTAIDRQERDSDYVNTVLSIRNKLNDEMTFRELLLQVRDSVVEAVKNQNYPLEALLNELNLSFYDNEFPLFNVAVLLDNIHCKNYISYVNPNIVFLFSRTDKGIKAELEYNTGLYDKKTIDTIIKYTVNLFNIVLNNVEINLSDIELVSFEEKIQLIEEFNDAKAPYPSYKLIHELFEDQVNRTPEKVAVIFDNKKITYQELNKKANQLARVLRKSGVKENSIVGLMVKRSIDMLIGIFGVLKAGGAYLPIDPNNPKDRNSFIVEDSNIKLLLTNKQLLSKIEFDREIILLDNEEIYQGDCSNPSTIGNSNSLAYVIYTSGTTGQPKGVLIEHKGLINYIWWAAKTYVSGEEINFPLYTSFSFDLTVTSIFTPLITGNSIIIYGEEKDILISKIIKDSRIGAIKLTPSHLKLIRNERIIESKVKLFILGGENLETSLVKDITNNFTEKIEVFNEYGPTEAVVGCMIHKYDYNKDNRKYVAIGKPIENAQIYILDRNLKVVPVGGVGEIYISGDGIARGYLNRKDLTSKKFIENPFCRGKYMYKTGDLARWITEDCIEFIGRIDEQINLKGFRIEPSEIETALRKHSKIREAVVLIKEDKYGEKSLYAYLVTDEELDVLEVKKYLSSDLPYYMIPAHFVEVEKIPLNRNGKIDKRELLKIDKTIKIESEYICPRDEIEEKLQKIWGDTLEADMIGVKDEFFNIGGDSIKSIRLLNKINTEFNTSYELIEIYENGTIEKFAKLLKGNENKSSDYEVNKVLQEMEDFKSKILNGVD